MPYRTLAATALACTLALPLQAANISGIFSDLYVFGDSLSDSGDSQRLPGTTILEDPSNTLAATTSVLGIPYPPVPYFNGRFSNSAVWSDTLIGEFEAAGKSGRNFAFGAARAVQNVQAPFDIPDFADQRLQFQLDPTISPGIRPLAVIFFGANDLFSLINAGAGDIPATNAAAEAVADEIGAQIALFDQLTVNDFALVNLADIGATPRYGAPTIQTALGAVPNTLFPLQAAASAASQAFNDQLSVVAAQLRGTGRTIFEVDAASAIADILADPAAAGFLDAISSCGTSAGTDIFGLPRYDFGQVDAFGNGSGISPTGCIAEPLSGLAGAPANVTQFAWFDDVHPTSVLQAGLANVIRGSISPTAPVPLPVPALMLVSGLVVLRAVRQRRDAAAA